MERAIKAKVLGTIHGNKKKESFFPCLTFFVMKNKQIYLLQGWYDNSWGQLQILESIDR